ncbi:MAG TPA: exonuclease domain-containing protein [Thermoleophilaceae bacterium]|nr:exonuclease domain-containing protein [Thermoleophilaceae bacterium]
MHLLDQPVAGAEFLAVDTETNGLAGDLCELTEVGAVLVGGGELHETFDSVVRTERPLSRGIQRFTGITQAMVDAAPPPEEVLEELCELLTGRVLIAHSARFDSRVLRQAFERCGFDWPKPPVLCTVQLARRFAPLSRKRSLAPLADSLGIDVTEVHRALPDALTCARVFCALFPRLCANAHTVADALDLLRGRRRANQGAGTAPIASECGQDARTGKPKPSERIPPSERPDLSTLPDDPGVYIFRDERGKPLYVGKSVSLRSRARAHFCAPAGWTERAAIADYRPTNSELGALVLENRLIKAWKPGGNKKLKRTDRYCYLRCRLDIPYPVLEVAAEPASGHAVNVGPLGSKPLATELADQLTSLYRLRHCGRTLKVREHPSAYGQMGRCVSPCLGDLDPNAYRRQLDLALSHFERPGAGEALIAEIDRRMLEASQEHRYERAAALLRRRERLAWVLERLEGVLRATHAAPRLVLAAHPVKDRHDAFWLVRGRLVDWGPLPGHSEMVERTASALARAPGRSVVPVDEVDEIRIVASWVADHEPPELALDPPPSAPALMRFVAESTEAATAAPAPARPRPSGSRASAPATSA